MKILKLLSCAPVLLAASLAILKSPAPLPAAAEQHLLYVASPGTRNYVEYGGVGILVFDIDNGYKFVRRIPTWSVPDGKEPENVKGIAASAADGAGICDLAQSHDRYRHGQREKDLGQDLRRRMRPDGDFARWQNLVCAAA